MLPIKNNQQEMISPTRPFDDCLTWLRARGRSSHTIRAYAQGLTEFAYLLAQKNIDVNTVGELELCNYLLYMRGEPVEGLPLRQRLSAATIRLRMAAVNQWFTQMERYGDVGVNPCRQLDARLKDDADEEAWVPSDEEWLRFLAELRLEPLRNRLMAVMSYDGALRCSTLINLEHRDIMLKNQAINVRADNSKGGSGATVVHLSNVGRQLYLTYAALLTTMPRENRPEKSKVFLSESNRNRNLAITESAWYKIVKKIGERAGLPLFTPHTFRHLRLTHMAEAGVDILEIQHYAAHKSIQTTSRYLHLRGDLAAKIATNHQLQAEEMKSIGLLGDL